MLEFRTVTVLGVVFLLLRTACSEENDAPTVNVLDRVKRHIVNEPEYVSSPRYVLLAFGSKAETEVWMVEDGRTLYLDKNANSDLTDDGPPLQPREERQLGPRRWDFDYILDEFGPPNGSRQTSFRVARWNYDSESDGYGLSITLNGSTPMYAGWTTFWADSPQAARVIHFGGRLQPVLLRAKDFVLEPGLKRMSVAFINRGSGDGAHSRLSIRAVPDHVIPEVQIDWPVAQGDPPLQTSHLLTERCCYWEFYTKAFEVPDAAVEGTARMTVSLPGYVSEIDFSTLQLDLPVRRKDSGG